MTSSDDVTTATSMTSQPTTVTMQFRYDQQHSDVFGTLNQQRNDAAFCDVIIRVAANTTSSIYAHRCILAASSDYFLGLFRHGSTDEKVSEVVIHTSSLDIVAGIVDFMYTGHINISEDTVQEIVRLADYLGVSKVLEFCCRFLKQNLRDNNCLKFKALSDFYPLGTLADAVRAYILPRMSTLVKGAETSDIPVEILRQLLSDNEVNYVREADVLQMIQNLISCHAELDPVEKGKACNLLEFIEFDYLPPEVIERKVLTQPDMLEWLRVRPQLLEKVRGMVFDEENDTGPRRNFMEAIICRGRATRTGDELQVMMYMVKDDVWLTLKQPKCENGVGLWAGLETMVTHDWCLYSFSSRTEDMDGYMHPPKETKVFSKLDLRTGDWQQLSSPSIVKGQTMLVSIEDSFVAIDRTGRVERYHVVEQRWSEWCCSGFPGTPNSTLCFLPMLKGDELFVLRSFSAGYSFYFSQRSLSICRLDASRHSWDELTQVEIVDLFYNGEEVNFFGYSISPGVISLKDELGDTRAQFDLDSLRWSTTPQRVTRPAFIRDIYGSASCAGRLYFVAKSALGNENVFVMFDHARCRFKKTQIPPSAVSGLMCHVTIPAKSVELLTCCRST